jgi:hypothetical protein
VKKRAILTLLALLPVLVGVGAAVAAGAFDGAQSATAKFHDVDKAIEAGYSVRVADKNGIECIAQPGEGAMGIHMLNPSLLDGTIEATQPELLVYEPRNNGTLKLVALEYLVFQSAWTGAAPPSLFGQTFDFIPAGNRYGLPPFYALHAWIWRPNVKGVLYPWNPRVDCG